MTPNIVQRKKMTLRTCIGIEHIFLGDSSRCQCLMLQSQNEPDTKCIRTCGTVGQ